MKSIISTFVFILVFTVNTLGQVKKEDFYGFISRFSYDSSFQVERIKFPIEIVGWKSNAFDSLQSQSITMEQWKFEYIFSPSAVSFSQVYDSFKAKLRDTDERVVELIGIENGISIKYYFKRISGAWYLVKREDSSD